MGSRLADNNHVKWAKEIKERDDYTCYICGKEGGSLHAHHLNGFDLFVEERYCLDNGVTLCEYHHDSFHLLFGNGKNTKFQFEEYKQILEILKKIADK